MRYLWITFILVSLSVSSNPVSVSDFGIKLKSMIIKNDQDLFKKIRCFSEHCFDSQSIELVFETTNNNKSIRNFLKQRITAIKVFGPVNVDMESKSRDFVIMFYDPALVNFNDEGFLNEHEREALWLQGYVETEIHCVQDECGFLRAPFYANYHLPWTEDY